ncbi:DNA polymerase zeta, partial [Kickxella alabastrina]
GSVAANMDTSTVTSLPEWPLLPPSVIRLPDAGATRPALMVQIVSIDSYMVVPTSADCLLWTPYNIFDEPLLQVPVIRIFGATASDQRICLHLHQIWPYIYVQYDGPSNLDAVREFGYHLGLSLNHALNISLRSNGLIFIAAVVPVKGVPFYGYHTGYRPFFKIKLTNPSMMARASSLLSSGAVMGRKMNVLGSHLSYVLQFLVDFNLHGMDWIHLNKMLFRSPLPQPAGGSSQMSGAIDDSNVANIYRWVPQGMPSYLVRPTPPDKISHCTLEADATAADIANRHQVQERHIHHIFREGKLGLHFGRLVHSLNSMWADENKRGVRHGLGELCPRNSQDQATLEESLLGMPASNGKAADAGADSSKCILWSNYWRMQSLLQSALAVDKCRLNDQQQKLPQPVLSALETQASCASTGDIESISSFDFAGANSGWLQCWPTCREVDIGEPRLIGDGGMSRKRFYTDAGEGLALLEQSGLVDATSSTTQPMAVSLTESTNDGHLTPRATQSVRPAIIIDVLLIDSNDSKDSASAESEDEQGFESYESARPVVDLGTASADNDLLDDFADFDDGWMENEVFRAEGGHTKDLYKYIPQTDGSNDFESSSKRRNVIDKSMQQQEQQGQQHRHRGRRQVKRRALIPLILRQSSVTVEPVISKPTTDLAAGLLLPDAARQKQGAAFTHSVISSMRPMWPPPECRAIQGNNLASRGTQQEISRPTNHTSDNIYIDIPHTEGFIFRKSRTGCYSRPSRSDIYIDIVVPPTSFALRLQHRQDQVLCYGSTVGVEQPTHMRSNSDYCKAVDSGDNVDFALQLCATDYDQSGYFVYAYHAPRWDALVDSMVEHAMAEVVVPQPQFSEVRDLPRKRKMYSGASISLSATCADNLPIFIPPCTSGRSRHAIGLCGVELLDDGIERRRHVMWSPVNLQRVNQSVGEEDGASTSTRISAKYSRGRWWVVAKRPPARSSFEEEAVYSANTDDYSILLTPANRRQQDQSDLKWSSVFGTMFTFPGSPASGHGSSAPRHTQTSVLQTLEMVAGCKPFMSQMSVEILTSCREEALPDPMLDSVLCVIACHIHDKPQWNEDAFSGCASVVWTWGPLLQIGRLGFPRHIEQRHHANEASMLRELAKWTRAIDPDVLCGFEVQGSSWGYLADRAERAFDIELESELSRIVTRQNSWQHSHNKLKGRGQGSWSQRKGATLNVVGRHVLNVWRLMCSELSLTSYTFENIVQKVLGEQSPHYLPHQLAAWFTSGPAVARIRALRHVHFRSRAALRILDQTGVVARASEFASVIGIDFAAVFMRGSQLRVESLMARIAHPELFVLASPTRKQVAQQRAAECFPLVLEPQSKYYTDPVVVLDFQSLYPSIMIAYNYCFSTCLGSVEEAAAVCSDTGDTKRRRLGVSSVDVPPGMLIALKDYLTVSPNGMLFVKPSVRRGLLGRMLQELLESRVMIKDAMKRWGDGDKALLKKLDAWQLGLKLITNVTYGYAGASFSGRMPCVEIADAIVQSGRETLESARVVYGDTDSVFIHLPGKSRESAFRIGNEIAEAVTELNPAPVKLKFEKVYQPCVLLTKKRYVGWMFTTPEQREPVLDVKGMELVRRDGCSATQKILEGTIDVLFRTNDLSLVKSFVTGELTKVLRGDMPLHEFVIAKEVRLGTYSKSTLPAHAKVAADGIKADARAEPKFGERVPYVVVSKGRDSRLTDQVVRSQILLRQPELRLDYQYYIDRQIVPALDRVLSLVGVDVRMWATEMPRRLRSSLYDAIADTHSDSDSEAGGGTVNELHNQQGIQALDGISGYAHGGPSNIDRAFGLRGFGMTVGSRRPAWRTLDHFYRKLSCLLCRQTIYAAPQSPRESSGLELGSTRVCSSCSADKAALAANVAVVQMNVGRALKAVVDKCTECVGENRADALQAVEACDCLDCPTMFRRVLISRRHAAWSRAAHQDSLADQML